MKIQVTADDGSTAFEYDTAKQSNCLFPARAEVPAISDALQEAARFLGSAPVEAIRADVRALIGRIETELGAHPALTWAQTTLGNAEEHLKQFIAGVWKEPDGALMQRVVRDVRGFPVKIS
jgi:hypothetical protein